VDDQQRRRRDRRDRRDRREFIRACHPDRGGDPEVFAAGLAERDQALVPVPAARVVAVKGSTFMPGLLKALARRIGGRRPPPRVR
jgi:hypothetical protein